MRRSIARYIAVLLVVGLFATGGTAQAAEFAKVGTVGSLFLNIPIGARGVAMGNAFSALSNDQSAMFWNPAGLVNVQNTTVMAERVNWFADIDLNAVGIAYSVNKFWTVGLFGVTMGSGDIERTTVEQPNGTGGNFNVSDMVAGISIASKLTDKFSFGANVKYVRENLDSEIAGAYAVDVGTLYDTRWQTIKLSMAIRNFGPEIQLSGGFHDYDNGTRLADETSFLPYHFPMIFRLGVTAEPLKTDIQQLIVLAELEHPNDNIERLNVGAEYGFQHMFFLRGGYTFRHDTLGLSAGIGARWKTFAIDYAFSNYSILDNVHRFSIQFGF